MSNPLSGSMLVSELSPRLNKIHWRIIVASTWHQNDGNNKPGGNQANLLTGFNAKNKHNAKFSIAT